MGKIASIVIKLRWLIIAVIVVVSGLFASQLPELRMEADIMSYLPESNPIVRFYKELGGRFNTNHAVAIAVEAEDVFAPEVMKRIDALTTFADEDEDYQSVLSMTNMMDLKMVDGALEVGDLVPEDVLKAVRAGESPPELTSIKAYTLSKKMFTNQIVNEKATVASVMVLIDNGANKADAAKKLMDYAKVAPGKGEAKIAGMPAFNVYIQEYIVGDMMVLIPIIVILIIGILFLSFGSLRGVAIPLMTVLIGLLWVFGLMAILDFPLTQISQILPVILISNGAAYGIHVLNRYYEEVQGKGSKQEKIETAMSHIGLPVILTGLTTAAGFGSIMTSELTLFQDFGLFAAIGIVFAFIITVLMVPGILSMLKERRLARLGTDNGTDAPQAAATDEGEGTTGRPSATAPEKGSKDVPRLEKLLDALGHLVIRRRKWFISLSGAIVVASVISTVFLLEFRVNFMEYFDEDSEARQAEKLITDNFGGALPVTMDVRPSYHGIWSAWPVGEMTKLAMAGIQPVANPLKDPYILTEVMYLEKLLGAVPHVQNPTSVSSLVAEVNRVMNGRRKIPDTWKKLGELWMQIEGQDIIDQLITEGLDEINVTARFDTHDSRIMDDAVLTMQALPSKLSTEVVPVDRTTLDDEAKAKLASFQAARVASMISLDLASEEYPSLDPVSLAKALEDIMAGTKLTPEQIAGRQVAVLAYLTGDVADLDLEEHEGLAASLAQTFAGATTKDKAAIKATLESLLPEDVKEDTEGVTLAATSISLALQQVDALMVVESAMAYVEGALTSAPPLTTHLTDAIKGDLYYLTDRYVGVPPALYTELTGQQPAFGATRSITVVQSGTPIVMSTLNKQLTMSQVNALAVAVVIVLILLVIQMRSFIGGLLTSVPVLLTIIFNFGFMSIRGMPLDLVTVMIASVAMGIGIDYTIHFMARFKDELSLGATFEEATVTTVKTAGKAILINTVSVMAGFLVLMFSSLAPLRTFGMLMALVMLLAAISANTIMPALILAIRPKFITKRATSTSKGA